MDINKSKRLFVAFSVPQDVKQTLQKLCYPIQGVRWVNVEDLHLTLRFIGHAKAGVVQRINRGLAALRADHVPITLKGVGFWPNVLWVGVAASPALLDMKQSVDRALDACNLSPDPKIFRPHVTLARVKRAFTMDDLNDFLRKNADFSYPPFMADHLSLYESRTVPEGQQYHEIARYALCSM